MTDTDADKAKATIGCLTIVFAFPATIIWWVLFGLILHKTDAGTAEWSLYVGYLILSLIAFTGGSILKLFFPD